jgi:hypothetical protein
MLQLREEARIFGLGSTSELVNLIILAHKKNLSKEFSEAENQRQKKCTLGEPWIVHIFIA